MVSLTGHPRLVLSNPSAGVWNGGEGGKGAFFGGGVTGTGPEMGYSWTSKEEATPSTNVFHCKNTGEAGQDGE